MKKCATDIKFLLGLLSAHILIYITYQDTKVFWYLYTATILFCMSFAITVDKTKIKQSSLTNLAYGTMSGILLFVLFMLSNYLIEWLNISSLTKDISQLYKHYSPSALWHYLVLFIIIIPGEEIFWRGFIQKKLMERFQTKGTIILSTILYTLPMFYSQNMALVLAGVVAGLVWATLYQWKKSISLVVISHLIFDFLLLVLFPLV